MKISPLNQMYLKFTLGTLGSVMKSKKNVTKYFVDISLLTRQNVCESDKIKMLLPAKDQFFLANILQTPRLRCSKLSLKFLNGRIGSPLPTTVDVLRVIFY